jgi:hypothetical protein
MKQSVKVSHNSCQLLNLELQADTLAGAQFNMETVGVHFVDSVSDRRSSIAVGQLYQSDSSWL